MQPTILIAETDPLLSEQFEIFLSLYGYRTLAASNGLECLSFIQSDCPAFVVASIDLLWDGFTEYLREESLIRSMPTMILTGFQVEKDVADVIELSSARYLRKPFLIGTLLDCIRGTRLVRSFDKRSNANSFDELFTNEGDRTSRQAWSKSN